jgi:hypothetical protein
VQLIWARVQLSEDQASEMFYKYTPALIQLDVIQTVKAWRRCKFLDPTKLIPSLVRYSTKAAAAAGSVPADQDAIISYLSFVIRRGKHKSSAVYNYLLSLYAERVRAACKAMAAVIVLHCVAQCGACVCRATMTA